MLLNSKYSFIMIPTFYALVIRNDKGLYVLKDNKVPIICISTNRYFDTSKLLSYRVPCYTTVQNYFTSYGMKVTSIKHITYDWLDSTSNIIHPFKVNVILCTIEGKCPKHKLVRHDQVLITRDRYWIDLTMAGVPEIRPVESIKDWSEYPEGKNALFTSYEHYIKTKPINISS